MLNRTNVNDQVDEINRVVSIGDEITRAYGLKERLERTRPAFIRNSPHTEKTDVPLLAQLGEVLERTPLPQSLHSAKRTR